MRGCVLWIIRLLLTGLINWQFRAWLGPIEGYTMQVFGQYLRRQVYSYNTRLKSLSSFFPSNCSRLQRRFRTGSNLKSLGSARKVRVGSQVQGIFYHWFHIILREIGRLWYQMWLMLSCIFQNRGNTCWRMINLKRRSGLCHLRLSVFGLEVKREVARLVIKMGTAQWLRHVIMINC